MKPSFLLALLPAAATAATLPWPTASNTDALLPAARAFALVDAERNGDAVVVTWQVAPGYYLYRDHIAAQVLAPAGARLGTPRLPPAQAKTVPQLGRVQVYRGALRVTWPQAAGAPAITRVQVSYQGCADIGVCYPPQTRVVEIAAAGAQR
ncbi:MAG: protein-disulfide reductase DsbD N-terminal domain-containing protein [Gammaproteobacteria bacterium]|nr:protein-disulfide reductase DsbD N-terminal domain-containing protein [Gammaproteobacteria bacterium]